MSFSRSVSSPRLLVWCTLCLFASGLFGQTEFDQYISDTARKWKSSNRPVLDEAAMVSLGTQRDLDSLLVRFQRQTGIAVAVVTLPSLKGGQQEDFTNRLYEQVGIGKAGEDRGVLLLVALQERKIRIETGYGAEADLTDLEAKRIIDSIITPAFRTGDFGSGIETGVKAILNELQPGFAPMPSSANQGRSSKASNWKEKLILYAILAMIFFLWTFSPGGRRARRRGYRRRGGRGIWLGGGGGFGRGGGFGGGGGGGFGGFGGGMSGGGGASGGW